VPFLKGSRLALEVDNVFDSRQRVTDATGAVPLSYQPDLIDPRGRFIGLDFRKAF
jgi:iron complex outermembrane recepter protein